eukprot:TRINITY_DN68725_c0_g1_i1.p1 TRINITY_DN68725_c0_g1~~TRINITY_DN68725_c0_g1_i1.p1  ORF type:complete len:215 (+),score=45.08 TRINITY_DN68725_c0_g1_i1:78-722(+)
MSAAAAITGWRMGSERARVRPSGAMPIRRIAKHQEAEMMRQRKAKERAISSKLMDMYDADHSGLLDVMELERLLADYATNVFKVSRTPTDEDMDFLQLICGEKNSSTIGLEEVMKALHTWDDIIQQGPKVERLIRKFDKDEDCQIGESELKNVLRQLNDGTPVSDDELRWFMKIGDASGDGRLDPAELTRAVAAWMGNVFVPESESRSQCCTVF